MKQSMQDYEKVAQTSADIVADRMAKLFALFPEAITEGKIDFDKLRTALGGEVELQAERYNFTWKGKHEAISILQKPTQMTLAPSFDKSINSDKTHNLFIEGDNLEVLKLLYKPYFGHVKMIYIDPPYNTGNDFVYPDDYSDSLNNYLKLTGQRDNNGNNLTNKLETNGRLHSRWLSMMYPRLFLARQLLRDDGAIFVSIDDIEVHNLRMLMNEVFGEENFIANVIWQKKFSPQNDAKYLSDNHDHILLYAKQKENWNRNLLPISASVEERYANLDNDPREPWSSGDISVKTYAKANDYPILTPSGRIIRPPESRCWVFSKQKLEELIKDDRIWFGPNGNNVPRLKQFRSEVQSGIVPLTIWFHKEVGHNQEAKQELKEILDDVETVFDTPKPTRLIKRMMQIATSSSTHDIVLDFFAGSCSTAQAVLELNHEDNGNRQFIMVQLPVPTNNPQFPTIADLGKERVRRVLVRLMEDRKSQLDIRGEENPEDLGFRVFRLTLSNYLQWQDMSPTTDSNSYTEQLGMFNSLLIETWKAEDVLYEVALKEGYSLSSQVKQVESIIETTIWKVTDERKNQSFYLCLDNMIDSDVIRKLRLGKDDLFVCRELALDDTTISNLAAQCHLKTV